MKRVTIEKHRFDLDRVRTTPHVKVNPGSIIDQALQGSIRALELRYVDGSTVTYTLEEDDDDDDD